jgi:D-xylose transport system substrate-binding protein
MRGTQSMTVYKPLTRLADSAAEMAVKMARREVIIARDAIDNGFKPVPAVLSEVVPVDKANMMETVVKDGFHSARDLE